MTSKAPSEPLPAAEAASAIAWAATSAKSIGVAGQRGHEPLGQQAGRGAGHLPAVESSEPAA